MKAVFDTRAGSAYDDDITRRYHFPSRYLAVANDAVGDWVVYREPRRNQGREGYVAVAKVSAVRSDPSLANHHYADMTDFLPFDGTVPLRVDSQFFEYRLQEVVDPRLRGVALQGKSMRSLGDDEFSAIVQAGLRQTLDPGNAIRLGLAGSTVVAAVSELPAAPPAIQARIVGEFLVNRTLRDASFRRSVLDAYDSRCAVSGLRIINGGGRAEAEAAHIVPVADGGPDVVQNGLALSATAHWLFDRHLISLTDDYGLLVSHNRVPAELRGLFARHLDRIHLPDNPALLPHLPFIRRHRERFSNYVG